jgi:hypothetical protein
VNGFIVRRKNQQVKSADTLDCYDLAGAKSGCRKLESILIPTKYGAGWTPYLEMGTAAVTGDRLSMKAPIQRIVVFLSALRTHFEVCHRGVHTIVRQTSDDRISRAAVGAVRKGISIAPIAKVVDFFQTQPAGRNVRQNLCRHGATMGAMCNLESNKSDWIKLR